MDIGTAKVPEAEREGVPHHQIDVLDVTEEASVAAYQRHARADIEAVLARGALPVVAGGSGLYVRAALDRLEIPPTDPQVRAALLERLDREGVAALLAELRAADPQAADAIEPNNGRRVVRALEVIALTGRPFSATMPTREFVRPTVLVGLRTDREALDARIDASGRSGCSTRGWSRRPVAWSTSACARGAPRAGRSATPRRSPSSTARARSRMPSPTPRCAPGGWCAARSRGSAPTRGSPGSTRSSTDRMTCASACWSTSSGPRGRCVARAGTMSRMAERLTFTKGHGTENDFVLVPDLDGALGLTAAASGVAGRPAGRHRR